jgi:hypothetical protein
MATWCSSESASLPMVDVTRLADPSTALTDVTDPA